MGGWQIPLYCVLGVLGAIAIVVIIVASYLLWKEKRDKKRTIDETRGKYTQLQSKKVRFFK